MATNQNHSCQYSREEAEKANSLALTAVKETTNQSRESIDKIVTELKEAISKVDRRANDNESEVRVIMSQLLDVKSFSVERFSAQREAVSLALAAAKETTAIAQATADRAVAKAEAAAGKEYLESLITGLRSSFSEQIVAQKEAINAALVAAKDALTAALASAEKAIAKAEEATNKRFESVNEFRRTLGDQTSLFVQRNEYSVLSNAIIDRISVLELANRETVGKSKGVAFIGAMVAGSVAVVASLVAIAVVFASR